MNMLISRRAGRGERASPVLFLHSSDEKEKERGIESREREKRGWKSVRYCSGGKGISERTEKTNGGEGKCWKERGKRWKESVEMHL